MKALLLPFFTDHWGELKLKHCYLNKTLAHFCNRVIAVAAWCLHAASISTGFGLA
jgi:hypothetical protein